MKKYKIAVAGTGYVGLSIATLLSQHHHVTAVDIVPEKVEMINNRKPPIQDDYIEKYLAEKDLDLTATLDAYCLMTNHIHLLVETGDVEIGKFMKYMSECYAMYINHKYSYRGHVFESRYKSCLVKEDTYFLQTSRYIHLNPVKARMVTHPEEYLWSSYQTVIGIADDRITEKEKTLAYFSKNSVFYYREFVEVYRL